MIRSGSGIGRPRLACQWMECDDVAKWAKQSRHGFRGEGDGITETKQDYWQPALSRPHLWVNSTGTMVKCKESEAKGERKELKERRRSTIHTTERSTGTEASTYSFLP